LKLPTYYAKSLQTLKKLSKNNQTKLLNLFDELANIEINLITNTNNNIHLLAISSIIYNFNK
jgi:hypothetical protein